MKLPLEIRVPLAFALTLLLLIIIGGFSYRTMTTLREGIERRAHTYQVLTQTEELMKTLVDAETGTRGYVITGVESYLEPYREAQRDFPQQFARLRQLTNDNSNHHSRLDLLERLSREKFDVLQEGIDVRRTQGLSAITDRAQTGRGRLLMDQMRLIVKEIKNEDGHLLQQLNVALQSEISRTLTVIVLGSLLGILALGLANIAILREIKRRSAAEGSLEQANDELEARVAARTAELSEVNQTLRAEMARRAEAEAAERWQREWWRVTLSSIGDAVITTDGEGRINYINSTAQALTGWTLEEARGLPLDRVFSIVNEESRLPVESPIAKVLREGIVVGLANHTSLIAKDGSEVPIDDSGAPIRDDQGRILGAVLIFRDITAQKESERAQEQLLVSEHRAREQAEQANHLKDEFVATVSHELRAPLNAILGWARLLRGGKLDAEASAKAVETIERSAESQARLIEDLLDISRIITGKLQMEIRTIDSTAAARAALEIVTPAAEAKGVQLISDLDPDTSFISGDADRLQQIIWNLLSNAIKFTPRGGLVNVRLMRDQSHVVITIRDTGQGIEPEFLPHVFDRFRQADSSSVRKHGGLGLGLAIVRQLVELHGGTITAHSDGIGHGAAFTIRLPIMPLRVQATTFDPSTETGEWRLGLDANPLLKGLTILIVDDEEDARHMLAHLLIGYGAKVTAASSAAQALEILNQQQLDLMISDIGMPDADGYSLIRRVRELKIGPGGKLPAIALTAYAQAQDRMRALAAGFQHHVPKPVEPAELVTVIASLTGRLRAKDKQ
jgi:PAS domain S-box-containing protein